MEKKKIRLLAVQIGSVIAERDMNIAKVESLLTELLSRDVADFVFLPEVWNVGWDCESFPNNVESLDKSPSIDMLKNIAKKFSVNIIGGSIILLNSDLTITNTIPVINREGELVALYDKMHLFSYYGCNEGAYVKPGNSPVLVEIDGVNIGLSVCYDIRFPELYRAYRRAGADILVNLAAWGANKKIPWDAMTTSRAVENQTYFVALTQTGSLRDGSKNLGHSMIIDYKGDIIEETDVNECGIFADIDLDEMYLFREKCTVLKDIKNSYEVVVK